MKRPNDHSTLEEVVQWLHSKDFKVTDKAYAYFAKLHNLSPQELFTLVYNEDPDVDGVEMHLLTANKVYKPLSLVQKEEIYKHHSQHKTALLATLYNTNRQNVILAKRGEHQQHTEQLDYSTVTPITPSTTYGPLTAQQKQEIYEHHQDVPPKVLAQLYQTNHQNIRLAQKTEHHGKAATVKMTLVSKIKLTGRATWHDRTYAIIEALNNDPTLIDEVLYYISIGEQMPRKVIDVCVDLGGNVPQAVIAKEITHD